MMSVFIPTKEENTDGLHKRYFVEKVNGKNDPQAVYFVLRLDRHGDDPLWTESCRNAAFHLAQALYSRGHMIELAADLEALVAECSKELPA